MIVYSKSSLNKGVIGKLETPIKMIIEHESDLLTKKGGVCDWLFNVEKSSRFGETIINQNEFEIFKAVIEGNAAEPDTIYETNHKFIEHIQYMKEFIITAEMMEDANYGVAHDAKLRAENFTRAYYKTINKICEEALINGIKSKAYIANTYMDLTTADGKSLFHNTHTYGPKGSTDTQCNYYWGDVFSTGAAESRVYSTDAFVETLSELSVRLRNMKDENGEVLGYTADTIILPGNNAKTEAIVKKVCGTELAVGSNYNDINLHFGNWNIIVLPNWRPTNASIMIMSSEANKNLSGNMFFNRVPLTITDWVDHHTGNYVWNGRCRFGVGFGSYKHILLATDSAETIVNANRLY